MTGAGRRGPGLDEARARRGRIAGFAADLATGARHAVRRDPVTSG